MTEPAFIRVACTVRPLARLDADYNHMVALNGT